MRHPPSVRDLVALTTLLCVASPLGAASGPPHAKHFCVQQEPAAGAPQKATQPERSTGTALPGLTPLREVDESLVVLYALNAIYHTWPHGELDPEALPAWISATRARLDAVQRHASSHSVPLDSLCDDAQLLLTRYSAFLASNRLIDAAIADYERSSGEWGETMFVVNATFATNPLGIALLVADGIALLVDAAAEKDFIDQARRDLLKVELKHLQEQFETRLAHFGRVAEKLAAQHGWTRADVDFAPTAIRERDPFARYATTMAAPAFIVDAQGGIPQRVQDLLTVARLTPRGEALSWFRHQVLLDACAAANRICVREADNSYSGRPASSAAIAVATCLAALGEISGSDSDRIDSVSGVLAHAKDSLAPRRSLQGCIGELSRSLAFAGDFQLALHAADQATDFEADPYFLYRKARLLSLTGNTRASLDTLTAACRCGFDNIEYAKSDPDLAALRADAVLGFARFCEPDVAFESVEGTIYYDLKVTNKSPYPLSNVTATVYLHWSGGSLTDHSLPEVKSLPSGATHTWRNAWSKGWVETHEARFSGSSKQGSF